MPDVTLLVAPHYPAGDFAKNIDILWKPDPITIPPATAAHIESQWAFYESEARAQNKTLFNGPITQLLHATRLPNHRVQLTLGPSNYKTFLVTCLRDRPWFQTHAPQAISRALGNSVLLTHHDQALLGIRSNKVSAYAGRAHLIGGVLDLLNTEKFPATTPGLLAHLQLELQEEAHISPTDLAAEPRLLFVAKDEHLGQPEAVWIAETKTPLDQLATRIDLAEHSATILLPRQNLPHETWTRLTPEARQAWQFWSTPVVKRAASY